MELKEAFQKALEFEQNGHDIYREAANTSFNKLVKRTFNYLADEELKHIEAIKGYLEAEEINNEFEGQNMEEVKGFFNMTTEEFKEGIEFSESDVEAYKKAMALEEESYDFYKTQRDATDNDNVKAFFTFVMEQERAHYLMLEKTLRYIQDPAGFHQDEEDWSFEG